MNIFKVIFKRETLAPMLALIFASAISVGLVFARIVWTGRLAYGFLVWNLFLAWFPLLFALLVWEFRENGSARNWRCAAAGFGWLIFFPNAPYIFTDLTHLRTQYYSGHYWVDMVLVLMCAFTGLVLGFLSLYLMQSVVTRMFNRVAGWLFVATVMGLSGFGIYLGRFVRLHSWDIVLRPHRVISTLHDWAADPLASSNTSVFPALFATFLFIAYLMLYALTKMRPMEIAPAQLPAAEPQC